MSELRDVSRRLEGVHGRLAAAREQLARDPGILRRVDPEALLRSLAALIEEVVQAAEQLDEVRFGGPHPLKGQGTLPMDGSSGPTS